MERKERKRKKIGVEREWRWKGEGPKRSDAKGQSGERSKQGVLGTNLHLGVSSGEPVDRNGGEKGLTSVDQE